MLSKLRDSVIAITTILSMTGCQMSESIRYIHTPSEVFYKNFDIDNQKLHAFIDDEILFTASIKEANFGVYWIWLGFYTKKHEAYIMLNRAKISGNGFEKDLVIEEKFFINNETKRDSKVFDLRKNSFKLIEISADDLKKFINNDGTLKIEITYVLEDRTKKMSFTIEKTVDKRIIHPT